MNQVKRGVEASDIESGEDETEKKAKKELAPDNIFRRAEEDLRLQQEKRIKELDESWVKIVALQALLNETSTQEALGRFFHDKYEDKEVRNAVRYIKALKRESRPTVVRDSSWWAIKDHVPALFEGAIPGSRSCAHQIIHGTDIRVNKEKLKAMTKDPAWLKTIHSLAPQTKEAEKYYKD